MKMNTLPCHGVHWRCCLSAATRDPTTGEITDFVGESACAWGLPQPTQKHSHLVHDHGQLDTHWEHSHRPFPSREPSFHSISVMCRFWVCLFDTRSAHQNARWSKCPTHDHKHRVNPFNIAGSAQPRSMNGFRVPKRFFFFCAAARPQGGKIVTFLFDLLKRVLNRGWADSRM